MGNCVEGLFYRVLVRSRSHQYEQLAEMPNSQKTQQIPGKDKPPVEESVFSVTETSEVYPLIDS